MDNLGTLCLFGILAIVVLFMLPRLLGGRTFGRPGGVRRTYNDPDIGSRASFGAPEQPEYDSPEIRSRSAFGIPIGRRRSSSTQNVSRPGSSRVDSPKVRSRASFGRRRK
jgi:hypothetical protein